MVGFGETEVVLAGHGSSADPGAWQCLHQHASRLQSLGGFRSVKAGFLRQAPLLQEVVAQTTAPQVFVVPVFVSEGYFSEEMIPRLLGFRRESEADFKRTQHQAGRTIHYTRAIGTHPALADVVVARALEVVACHPFPRRPPPSQTALFVAGHGTSLNEQSRQAIDAQVERIRAQQLFAETHAVFMEESPRIPHIYELTTQGHLVVVPLFITDGPHVSVDIPILLGEPEAVVKERRSQGRPPWRNPTQRHGRLVWYATSLGEAPQVADVILARVREAGGENRPR